MKKKYLVQSSIIFFYLIIFSIYLLNAPHSFSQGIGVNNTGNPPDNSSALDIDGANNLTNAKGLLIPRMTTTERNTITAPIPESLLIFNTSTRCFEAYNSLILQWVSIRCLGCLLPEYFNAGDATNVLATSFSANWSSSAGATYYLLDVSDNSTFSSFVSGCGGSPCNSFNVGNTNTYSVTGLSSGITYYYRIYAANACGITVPSNVINTCATPPTDVTATATPNPVCLGATLTLNGSATNATSWSWSGPNGFSSTMQNPTVANMSSATAGVYTLTASNSVGPATPVNTASVSLITIPGTPTAGTHVATITQITWNWNSVSGATGYKWNTVNNFTTATATNPAGTTSYIQTGLTCGNDYTLYVWAYNDCGPSASPVTLTQSTGNPTPSQPVLQTTFPCRNHINFYWNVQACVRYKWNTVNDYSTADDIGTAIMGGYSGYIPSGLTCNTSYTFYLWAYNAAGYSAVTIMTESTTACLTPGTACSWNGSTTFSKSHTAGAVAPVTKTVTYHQIQTPASGASKCWITQNLGADNEASSYNDDTQAAQGWYWQFNRQQGFQHDGTTRTPATAWITPINESSDWQAANDPCALLLGTGWRLPTYTEWVNVDDYSCAQFYPEGYSFDLNLHTSNRGFLDYSTGDILTGYGYNSKFWSSKSSSNTIGWAYKGGSDYWNPGTFNKAQGNSIRCLKD